MNIINNINALLAKLTEKQYAPYKKLYENMKEEYDKRYDHIFGAGNNRIYLNDIILINKENYINKYINSASIVSLYIKIFFWYLNKPIPCDFTISSDEYLEGKFKINNREYSIGKILNEMKNNKIKIQNSDNIKKMLENKEKLSPRFVEYHLNTIDDTLKIFNSRPNIKDVECQVVISRDPYDIAGMSTDRRWTSCMRLPNDNDPYDEGGQCNYYLQHDIKLGTLVAYLIEPTDKNIDKPYARIAIKPHQSVENKSVYLFSEDKVYHDNSLGDDTYEKFKSTVDKFLSEVQDESEGIFMLPGRLYNDSYSRVKTQGNLIKHIDFDYMFNIEDGKKILKNFSLLSDYTFGYDIYIFNNKKYNQSYENNLVTVVEDKIALFHNLTNDEKIYNVYSIYITKAKEPIEKHIVRIDISIGVISEFIKTEYNKLIVNRPKIYIEKLCVKDNLKNDEDFIDNIFNFVKYIYYIRVK